MILINERFSIQKASYEVCRPLFAINIYQLFIIKVYFTSEVPLIKYKYDIRFEF